MSDEQSSNKPPNLDDKRLYKDALIYIDSILKLNGDESKPFVAFLMRDGSYKFSQCDPLGVLLTIIEESHLSDRLLVIVCVAYLEDQIRLLLARFLAKDDETSKLLDPENGPLPLLAAARLAFSSGLIAKEWLEILKEMAKLRNKFAHKPVAQSFEDLLKSSSKDTWKSLDNLSRLYTQITQEELTETIHGNFGRVFRLMYTLIQFSIDHLATTKPVQILKDNEIISVSYLMGLTRETIQSIIDNNYQEL